MPFLATPKVETGLLRYIGGKVTLMPKEDVMKWAESTELCSKVTAMRAMHSLWQRQLLEMVPMANDHSTWYKLTPEGQRYLENLDEADYLNSLEEQIDRGGA